MNKKYTVIELYALTPDHPSGDHIIDAVALLLQRHPGLAPCAIANTLGVSRRDLSGAIRILMGITLEQLTNHWRMMTALELLRDSSIDFQTIALRCGYQHGKTLARALKRELHLTPFEYRNGYRRGASRHSPK